MGTTFDKFTTNVDYVRCTTQAVLTRNLYFWAERQECFWLLHLYASHLFDINGEREWFTVLNMSVRNSRASIRIEDGNGKLLSKQVVDYTDFKHSEAQLYGCWQSPYWVLMLPNDY
jgi:hypothetical protein